MVHVLRFFFFFTERALIRIEVPIWKTSLEFFSSIDAFVEESSYEKFTFLGYPKIFRGFVIKMIGLILIPLLCSSACIAFIMEATLNWLLEN